MKRIPTTEPPATVQEATTVMPTEPTLAELRMRRDDAYRAASAADRACVLADRAVRERELRKEPSP